MQKVKNNVAVIILAAGLGTRMKSDKAKVLHEVLGRPMIIYVVDTAKKVGGDDVILVVGHQADKVREIVSEHTQVNFAFQDKQLGTGHAVLCALPLMPADIEAVIILCGDVPILTSDTVQSLLDDHIAAKRDLSLLAVNVENPDGYGRILTDKNRRLIKIVEEADATEEQKRIKTINAGIYCVKKEFLADSLQKIKPDNVRGELYLTDVIEIGHKGGKVVGVLYGNDCEEVVGVNSCQDLMTAETIMRKRLSKIS
ncbi:NTP transferase domain-containing protein [Thermodesulfobacteriota bacterium]